MIDKGMIKKLSSAGVSPEIILNLVLDEDEPEQAAEVRAEPAQVEQAPPAETVTAAPVPEPRKDDAILAAIEKLTGAIHASNMRRDSAGDPAQAETADTILAQIINPQANRKV